MVCEQIINAEEGENDESPSSSAKLDVIDMPSKKADVSNFDIFCLVTSIVTHIIDLLFDINVAWHYFSTEKYWYFGCTLFVILVPSFINNAVSHRMRQQDVEKLQDSPVEHRPLTFLHMSETLLSIIFQIAPLKRYFISLKYALTSRKCKKMEDTTGQKQYYLKMVKENQDIALITVFECFMETAPQQVVQMSIILTTSFSGGFTLTLLHQILSIVSSFVSMGWAMASYHRSIRLAQDDKLNIGVTGSVLQFLWHLLVTVSRIVTFATAFTISSLGSALFFLIHWMLMTAWITTESHGSTEFCRNRKHTPHAPLSLKERFFSTCFGSILGVVYTFVYVNPDDNNTFMRHSLYYSFCILENLTVSILWIFTPSVRSVVYCFCESCFIYILPVLCLIPYVLGVAIMIVYYLFFHPSKREKASYEP